MSRNEPCKSSQATGNTQTCTKTDKQTAAILPSAAPAATNYCPPRSRREFVRDRPQRGPSRATVTKFVRSEAVAQFVAEQRAKLYGYLDAALSAVFSGLSAGDHEFAYRFL
jgi:hypothetical protein